VDSNDPFRVDALAAKGLKRKKKKKKERTKDGAERLQAFSILLPPLPSPSASPCLRVNAGVAENSRRLDRVVRKEGRAGWGGGEEEGERSGDSMSCDAHHCSVGRPGSIVREKTKETRKNGEHSNREQEIGRMKRERERERKRERGRERERERRE
jgi:hypothetical protein